MGCQMKTAIIKTQDIPAWITQSVLCCMLACLAGCAKSGGGNGNGSNPPPSVSVSGNWEIQATQTKGTAPFSSLAGFINDQGNSTTGSNFTTAALQATQSQTSLCYGSGAVIPLEGALQGGQLGLTSFSVDGQFLTLTAMEDSTGTHLTGTYSISGGCADGVKGTITGTEYAVLTGTYSGSVTGSSPARTIVLTLSQIPQGSGDGIFLVTGSAVFGGFNCFTNGTLPNSTSYVIGSFVSLTLNTDDANGAQVVMTGTIDSAADTFTVNSIAVNGGNCAGSLGAATLTRPTS
jgi:hypothetical protein